SPGTVTIPPVPWDRTASRDAATMSAPSWLSRSCPWSYFPGVAATTVAASEPALAPDSSVSAGTTTITAPVVPDFGGETEILELSVPSLNPGDEAATRYTPAPSLGAALTRVTAVALVVHVPESTVPNDSAWSLNRTWLKGSIALHSMA